jgi:hypothetical protein
VADARVAANVCRHPPEDYWRLAGGKWICGICHPPAVPGIERVGDTPAAFACNVDESGGVRDEA